jgi:hypothetical protein
MSKRSHSNRATVTPDRAMSALHTTPAMNGICTYQAAQPAPGRDGNSETRGTVYCKRRPGP